MIINSYSITKKKHIKIVNLREWEDEGVKKNNFFPLNFQPALLLGLLAYLVAKRVGEEIYNMTVIPQC